MTEQDKIRAYDLEKHINSISNKDDERLRKTTIAFLKDFADKGYENAVECIDWLEKQGEQKEYTFKSIPRLLDMIEPTERAKVYTEKLINTLNEEGYITDAKIVEERLKQMNGEHVAMAVMDEKHGEQKPDKVEPKFKGGDWITNGACIIQITSVDDEYYWQDNDCVGGDIESIDKGYHLWTITKDAKDGDVLATEDKNFETPFVAIYKSFGDTVYKGLRDNLTFNSHCFIGFNGNFYEGEDGHAIENIHPATKEQRDLLFQKMKEAGYEWDAEKKELKKIEDEPENYKQQIMSEITNLVTDYIKQKPTQEIEPTPIFRIGDILKRKGKDYTFRVDRIQGGYYHCDRNYGAFFPIEEQDNWELVGQNPAWSEDDNDDAWMNDIISKVENNLQLNKAEIDWLKSLKDRYTWKPSDEQMTTLEYYMHALVCNEHKEILFGLYADLKKLKENKL